VIVIDIDQRSLSVKLSDDEIQRRLKALPEFKIRTQSKWLRRYAHFVTSADRGAILEM
jgi:dihydroxy-acid dehydratase